MTAGRYLLCYATSASGGDGNQDYIGQLDVTVVAAAATSLTTDNAKPGEAAANVDVTCSTDAPNGDYLALVSTGSTNCAGTAQAAALCTVL